MMPIQKQHKIKYIYFIIIKYICQLLSSIFIFPVNMSQYGLRFAVAVF